MYIEQPFVVYELQKSFKKYIGVCWLSVVS